MLDAAEDDDETRRVLVASSSVEITNHVAIVRQLKGFPLTKIVFPIDN